MRYKLTLAYDGRAFTGWQSQPHGRSAQDVLESRLGRILEIPLLRVHGAGRTDAGVHALGQVAHFDAPDSLTMDGADWQRALNAHLPPALRVLACDPVAPTFNAQFDASGKRYHYRICRLPVLPPLLCLDPGSTKELLPLIRSGKIFAGLRNRSRTFQYDPKDSPQALFDQNFALVDQQTAEAELNKDHKALVPLQTEGK